MNFNIFIALNIRLLDIQKGIQIGNGYGTN
jgi:hypothetical protein